MTAVDIPLDISAFEDWPPFLRTPEVAKVMRKSANAVVQDRYLGLGPRYIRDGRRILYAKSDVLDYMRQHTVQPGDGQPAPSRD